MVLSVVSDEAISTSKIASSDLKTFKCRSEFFSISQTFSYLEDEPGLPVASVCISELARKSKLEVRMNCSRCLECSSQNRFKAVTVMFPVDTAVKCQAAKNCDLPVAR